MSEGQADFCRTANSVAGKVGGKYLDNGENPGKAVLATSFGMNSGFYTHLEHLNSIV